MQQKSIENSFIIKNTEKSIKADDENDKFNIIQI